MSHVLRSDQEEGIAQFTVSIGEDDHRFEAWTEEYEGETRCLVSYEETHTWRGRMDVLPEGPETDVWEILHASDQFLDFIEETGADTIRRDH